MDTNSKKYRTILADPPWDLNQRGNYGAIKHYDLMPLERIKAMPVADLCEESAHLYLWCPNGLLPQALEVITAFGFTFRSPIYWIKPRLGLGVYIRNASETCLLLRAAGSREIPRPAELAIRASTTPSLRKTCRAVCHYRTTVRRTLSGALRPPPPAGVGVLGK